MFRFLAYSMKHILLSSFQSSFSFALQSLMRWLHQATEEQRNWAGKQESFSSSQSTCCWHVMNIHLKRCLISYLFVISLVIYSSPKQLPNNFFTLLTASKIIWILALTCNSATDIFICLKCTVMVCHMV